MAMIDLFAGAGGLSRGLERAGFEAVQAVEIDPDAAQTYRTLFPHVDLIEADIRKVSFAHLRGQVDLVAGGPPCQPFSSGGRRLAQGDPRNMVPEFLRVVREVQPQVVLMENVPGLATGERKAYLDEILAELQHTLGYAVTWKILHAVDYGVPQKRKRLIIVGSKVGPFAFPAPTHGPGTGQPYEPAGNYLSKHEIWGTPNPSKVTYAKNPDLRPSPYDGHLFNGGGRPINLAEPCHTILASAGGNKTHFIDTHDEVPAYHAALLNGDPPRSGSLRGGRRLTVEESARLQTFPEGIHFAGSRSSQYKQVGNAVPPLLAFRIGEALQALLAGANRETVIL